MTRRTDVRCRQTGSRRRRAGLVMMMAMVFGLWSHAAHAAAPRQWTLAGDHLPLGVASRTDTVPGSNNIVDIIFSSPTIWAGTASGVSRADLPDVSWTLSPAAMQWTTYTKEDGLGSNEIPALGVFPSGVWAATSHAEVRSDRLVRFGNGIFQFNAGTGHWIDRSPADRQASGPFMVTYDLAEFRGAVLAACFAGGLVMTTDGGATWKNIFPDGTAKNDFETKQFLDLNNRLFSVVADPAVAESAAVYAGTAYGINKYIYLNDTLKMTGHRAADLAVDGSRLYAATESGLARTPDRGSSWKTYYPSRAFPTSDRITAVMARGDTIYYGIASADGTAGNGIIYSLDNGHTWHWSQPSEAMGPGRQVAAIALEAGMVFAACEDGGFICSANLGLSWDPVFTDQPAHALLVVRTTPSAWRIYVGTDIGIIRYLLPVAELPRSLDTIAVGSFSDNLSQRVVRMGLQPAPCSTIFSPADTVIWALCRARSGVGGTDGFAISGDSGATWGVSARRLPVNDVAFNGCQFFLASDSGLAVGNLRNISDMAFLSTYENLITAGRVKRPVRSVAAQFGRDFNGADSMIALWAGSDSGLAFTFNAAVQWGVVFANSDPHEYDLIQRFISRGVDTATSKFVQLSGNFVTTLALQPYGGARVIWAATQATGQGRATTITTPFKEANGVSTSRDGGQSWSVPLVGHQVWNFAFDGPTVWAASSQGLLRSDDGIQWDTLTNFVDPITGAKIDSTVEIFAVEVVGNEVWIGTENGFGILNTDGSVKSIKRTFQPVDPATPGADGGAYANPVPYSPSLTSGGLRLHYKPPVSGPVTITIYDFANHVVKVLLDRASRDAGRQYDETDLWDGRNGEGDIVAVGTYFFVIEYANGAVHWGKIPIIR